MHVMFYVQHLLGIGHIRRAALLSAAMERHGQDVTVILGGRDVPGIEFGAARLIRLPEAHVADHHFHPLLDENEIPVDDGWKERRRERLLEAFRAVNPDALLFELYPFGRRQFRFELLPLLEAARERRTRPLVLSSIRDILVSKSKPVRNREIADLVRKHFDLVLVHGDPTLIRLEDTFPEASSLSDLIRYTGYIAAPQEAGPTLAGKGEVIVSAGGGAVGAPLFRAALRAKGRCRLSDKPWRIVTGPNLPEEEFRFLQDQNVDGVSVERYRLDLPRMLVNCALSISQGGYNTIMDLLWAKSRAIVVPYDEGGESEQLTRARLLAKRKALQLLESRSLSATTLSKAIDETMGQHANALAAINTRGAETSARIIAEYSQPEKLAGGVHG